MCARHGVELGGGSPLWAESNRSTSLSKGVLCRLCSGKGWWRLSRTAELISYMSNGFRQVVKRSIGTAVCEIACRVVLEDGGRKAPSCSIPLEFTSKGQHKNIKSKGPRPIIFFFYDKRLDGILIKAALLL